MLGPFRTYRPPSARPPGRGGEVLVLLPVDRRGRAPRPGDLVPRAWGWAEVVSASPASSASPRRLCWALVLRRLTEREEAVVGVLRG